MPIALERDDAKDVALEYTLIFNAGADGLDASEFARRLAGLRAVNMTIVWAYRRPKLPSLRKRGTLVRRQPITIAADTLRQSCIVGWQDNPRWHYLVDTAQGREPPAN